jgi:hypothetical protein
MVLRLVEKLYKYPEKQSDLLSSSSNFLEIIHAEACVGNRVMKVALMNNLQFITGLP